MSLLSFACWVVSAGFLGFDPSTGLSKPLWVEFDDRMNSSQSKLEVFLLENEFLPPEYQHRLNVEQLKKLEPYYYFEDTVNFKWTGGVAHSVNATGQLVSFRFRTVSSREVFQSFVDHQMERKGPTATVTNNGNLAVIKKPSTVVKRGRIKKTSHFEDLYIRYAGGIVLWGGEEIQQVNAAHVQELCQRAGDHDWSFYAAPKQIGDLFRDRLLELSRINAETLMQPRDGESENQASTRKMALQMQQDFLVECFEGIESVFLSMDLPSGEEDYRFRVDVSAEGGSDFTRRMQEFIPRKDLTQTLKASPIFDLRIGLQIPEDVKGLVRSFLNADDSIVKELSERLFDFGRLEIAATIPKSSQGQVLASMGGDFGSLRHFVSGAPRVLSPFRYRNKEGTDIEFARLNFDSGALISIGRPNLSAAIAQAQADRNAPPGLYMGHLLRLNISLNDMISTEDFPAFKDTFLFCERLYSHIVAFAPIRRDSARQKAVQQEFESLWDRLPEVSPLEFKLKLDCSRDARKIAFDLKVSRDLYAWFLARRRVSAITNSRAIMGP